MFAELFHSIVWKQKPDFGPDVWHLFFLYVALLVIVGTFSVIFAAWLMYEKNWREEDED